MKLNELAQAVRPVGQSILIYGAPKTGKTRLAGTIAQLPHINRIVWIDLENGFSTLLNMGLTTEELAKIELIRISDTRENPRACLALARMFSAKSSVWLSPMGDILQAPATDASTFCLREYNTSDVIVIDGGSQLGDSILAYACRDKTFDHKPGFDEWGMVNKVLTDIMSQIQQAGTNIILLTHEIVVEEEINGVKRDKVFPLLGTRAFSMKAAKYFSSVIYTELKMNKHVAGSSATYKMNYMTGSRLGIMLEKQTSPSMALFFPAPTSTALVPHKGGNT